MLGQVAVGGRVGAVDQVGGGWCPDGWLGESVQWKDPTLS